MFASCFFSAIGINVIYETIFFFLFSVVVMPSMNSNGVVCMHDTGSWCLHTYVSSDVSLNARSQVSWVGQGPVPPAGAFSNKTRKKFHTHAHIHTEIM